MKNGNGIRSFSRNGFLFYTYKSSRSHTIREYCKLLSLQLEVTELAVVVGRAPAAEADHPMPGEDNGTRRDAAAWDRAKLHTCPTTSPSTNHGTTPPDLTRQATSSLIRRNLRSNPPIQCTVERMADARNRTTRTVECRGERPAGDLNPNAVPAIAPALDDPRQLPVLGGTEAPVPALRELKAASAVAAVAQAADRRVTAATADTDERWLGLRRPRVCHS